MQLQLLTCITIYNALYAKTNITTITNTIIIVIILTPSPYHLLIIKSQKCRSD